MHRLLHDTPLLTVGKALLIGCLIALAVLAWTPANAMSRTSLGGHAEHLIAYLGTAMVMGLTARTAPRLAVRCLLLVAYAAILEGGQLHAAGRHASFQDFAVSAGGALLGCLVAGIARTCWTRSGNGSVPRDRSAGGRRKA